MRFFSVILGILLATGKFSMAQNFVKHAVTSSKATSSEQYQSITFNGVWCWFSDPRAVYYEGKFKRTYIGWIDNYGDVHIGYYDHDTQQVASEVIYDNLEIDDHDNPTILFDDDGKLLVFFNTHLQDERPLFLRKSLQPETINAWSPVQELYLNDDEKYRKARILRHTYTNPVRLSEEDGKIYVFWRGVDLKPSFSVSADNGETWSAGEILFQPKETYDLKTPYTKVYSDGKSRIHFVFTDGHPAKDEKNSLYYMYYEKGAFYKANGTKIRELSNLPVQADELDIVYTSETIKVWNWDIAQDAKDNPIITYVKFPNEDEHVYCYATFTNGVWKSYELIDAGGWFPKTRKNTKETSPHYSGGIVIDHENPNTVYMSVKRDSVFEIEQWTTHDLGKSWNVKLITNGSTKDNIRPFAIRGAKKENPLQIAWLQNTNYVYYAHQTRGKTDELDFKDRYHTAVKINIPKPALHSQLSTKNVLSFLRVIAERSLENPNHALLPTDWRFGLNYAGIKAFAEITGEQRYQNELDNIQQYTTEETSEDELSITDIIWSYQTPNERSYLQKIESLNVKDLPNEDADIALASWIHAMDTYESQLTTIEELKEYLKKSSDTFLELLTANYVGKTYRTRALAIYALATGIRTGYFDEKYSKEVLKQWKLLQKELLEKDYTATVNTETSGAILLAGAEVYKILKFTH
ncbi:BNR-4 repeat-containing protein [Kordia zhangzhouensis]|uniref:BNR-4 repeat-containing protein n=1 Tax=Kordia zhangzhouensis TaxID=1620405 RepID=UPI000629BDE8|nr:BNR-4 repeat-containing protein [Kordia zhangzhouensis]